jgi:hypothetical protein
MPSDWIVSTYLGTTEDDFRGLLSFLFNNYSLTADKVKSSPALGFQQFVVKTNDTCASEIQKLPAVS